jgi:hypothetical protein
MLIGILSKWKPAHEAQGHIPIRLHAPLAHQQA